MSDIVEPDQPKPTLAVCETIIAQGVRARWEAAVALAYVREHKLYMDDGFVTFEVYCSVRWGYESNYARRLIAAGQTLELLPADVPRDHLSEGTLRPLTKLGDDATTVQAVWNVATAEAQKRGRNMPAAADLTAAIAATVPNGTPKKKGDPPPRPGSVNFETATVGELVTLGKPCLLTVQRKINNALDVIRRG